MILRQIDFSASSGDDSGKAHNRGGRFRTKRGVPERRNPIVLELVGQIECSFRVLACGRIDSACELDGNICLEHSFGICATRLNFIKRGVLLANVDSLRQRNQCLPAEVSDCLAALLRISFQKAKAYLANLSIYSRPTCGLFENLDPISQRLSSEYRPSRYLTLLNQVPTILSQMVVEAFDQSLCFH